MAVSQAFLDKYKVKPKITPERKGGILGSVAEIGIGAGAEAYRVAANMMSGVLSASDYINPVSWAQKAMGQKTFGQMTGGAIKKAGEQISGGIEETYKGAGVDISTGYGKVGKGITDVASTIVAGGAGGRLLGGAAKGIGLAGKIATGAGFAGESMAATSAIVKGIKDEEVTAGKLAKGMAIDLATLGAFKLIGAVIKPVGKLLYKSGFKEPIKDVKKSMRLGESSVIDDFLEKGWSGTEKSLYKVGRDQLDLWDDGLEGILKQVDDQATKNINPYARSLIKKSELTSYLDDYMDDIASGHFGSRQADLAKIQQVIDDLPDRLTLVEANKIKRSIYNEIGDLSYKLDSNLTVARDAKKNLARGIKELIEQKTSGVTFNGLKIKDVNQQLKIAGKLRDQMENSLALAQRRALGGLSDYGTAAIGTIAGGPVTGVGLVAAKKLAGSTMFKTTFGKMLYNIGKFPSTVAGKQANNLIDFLIKEAMLTGEPNELVSESQMRELQQASTLQSGGYITRPSQENLSPDGPKYNLRRTF